MMAQAAAIAVTETPGGIVAALEQAWNTHDAEAWAASFRNDAQFTNVFGMTVGGRAEIERIHAHIFATAFRDSTAHFEAPDIRLLRPDVATVSVRWRMSGAYDASGKPWDDRKGVLSFVATQEHGVWRIAFMVNMEPLAQPSVGPMQTCAGGSRI
jgi:uncharacterized protein (TIGR02246 family)